jgi:hypothetical protein
MVRYSPPKNISDELICIWVIEDLAEMKRVPISVYHMLCTEAWVPGWLEWFEPLKLEEVIY